MTPRPRRRLPRPVRWLRLPLLAVPVGVLSGGASALFLVVLDRATEARIEHPWLLWLLPVGGLVVGWAYQELGGRSAEGNHLIVDEIHEPRAWVPRRMAPLVFGGTVVTHLLGGSAGREGTAIQMAGSLTDAMSRALRLRRGSRRVLLMAAIAGGFGSVFGVPWAGVVFALEVQSSTVHRIRAAVPALVASFVGDQVVRRLGVHHTATPRIEAAAIDWSVGLVLRVALAGVAMGLVAWTFVVLTRTLKAALGRALPSAPLRLAAGGAAVVALALAVDSRDYLGLSLPLVVDALAGGADVATWAFAAKLAFTAVTLGAGFPGGEVTPLFVIGATLGTTLAAWMGLPPVLLAAVGFVAVFAGAANTPLACTIMAVELFGPAVAPVALVACLASHLCSPTAGIYGAPRTAR